jgi:prolyl-tRNA synthetase
MLTKKSFESAEKTMKSSAEKFTPAAAQEAFQPMIDNLKAWSDLVQEQAQASQAAVAETFEAFKDIKEPQAAFDAMSAFAENITAMFTKNIKDAVALSVAQFKGNVASLENKLPASEAVTHIANGLKDAASKVENSVESAVSDGAAAVKKARTA